MKNLLKISNCRRPTVISHIQIGVNRSISDIDFTKVDLYLEKINGYKFFKRNTLSTFDLLILYWTWISSVIKSSKILAFPYDLNLILLDFISLAEKDKNTASIVTKFLAPNWKTQNKSYSELYTVANNIAKEIKDKVSKDIKSLKGYSLYIYEDRVINPTKESFYRKQKISKFIFNLLSNYIILNSKYNTKIWSKGIYIEKIKAILKPTLSRDLYKHCYDYLTYIGLRNYFFTENYNIRKHNIQDIWETRKYYKKLLQLNNMDYEEKAIANTIEHWAKYKNDPHLSYNRITDKWGRWDIDTSGNSMPLFVEHYSSDELDEITTFVAEEKNAIEIEANKEKDRLKYIAEKLYSQLEINGILYETF